MFKIIMVGLLSCFCFTGCSLLPKVTVSKPTIVKSNKRNEEVYKVSGYRDVAGKATKFNIYHKKYNKGSKQSVPKKTLMEKLGSWIAGLSFMSFILLGLGLFFFPTITISILWMVKVRLANALKETVQAIKECKADEQIDLHNALKYRHTQKTKKVINTMKAGL